MYAPRRGFFWTCAKEPTTYTDSFPGLSDEEIEQMFQYSIPKSEILRTREEIVARNLITNKIFISIRNQERYAFFIYSPEKGKYEMTGKDVIRVYVQDTYSRLFSDEMIPRTLAESVMYDIASYTDRGTDMKVFENDDGLVYFVPFRDSEAQVNRKTGEVQILPKDPVKRPFLSVLPYSILNSGENGMPEELRGLLELVPPSFRNELLMEIASPLAFQGSRRIFVNFSRAGSSGKTTLLKRIEELYPDLTVWAEPDTLAERFQKSAFIGKSSVLIDEYEGGGLIMRRQLKTLASANTLRAEIKNGPILQIKNRLSVIMNTNSLQFDYTDQALLTRLIVIPFIKNFNESREVEPWSEEVKKKIVLYLVKNVVPKYFLTELHRYPVEKMKSWAEASMSGECFSFLSLVRGGVDAPQG